jgi:GT2 family glycosyltransferase
MKKVGIVLVNYKEYANKYLSACRDTLRTQTYTDFIVYIIDNASSSESITYLKNSYPEAVILPREDGNYCAANNLGMKQAITDGCDYLVAANMDTEFEPDWLKELVLALVNNPEAGIAQSLILLYPKTEAERLDPKINTSGNVIHFLFFGFTSNYNLKKSAVILNNYQEITGYASGCSFIIRSEIFTKIGCYNEDYYMYHDDLDISLKTKLAGYKIILATNSIMWHKYEFERSVRMLYYMERNRAISFLVFYPIGIILLLSPVFVAMSLGMALFSILGGWFTTKLKVSISFLKLSTWKLITKMRREHRQITKENLSNIAKKFSGRIEFQEIDNPILKYLVNPVFNAYWNLVKKII